MFFSAFGRRLLANAISSLYQGTCGLVFTVFSLQRLMLVNYAGQGRIVLDNKLLRISRYKQLLTVNAA